MSRVSLLAAAEVLCLHPPVTAAGHSVSVRLAIGASKFCVLLEERVPITAASSWPMCHATLPRGFDRQRRGRAADVDPRLQPARWPAGHRAVMPPRRAARAHSLGRTAGGHESPWRQATGQDRVPARRAAFPLGSRTAGLGTRRPARRTRLSRHSREAPRSAGRRRSRPDWDGPASVNLSP